MSAWTPKSVAATAAVGMLGTAALAWGKSDPEGFVIDPSSLENQSIPHPMIPACRMSKYPELEMGNITSTLYDALLTAVQENGDKDFFGWRSSSKTGFDKWLSYSQVLERVTNIGYGLRWLNQKPSNDTFIGIFSKNRVEMAMTQFACYQHSMVIVPMYDTLGDEGVQHIVNQAKMEVVICDDERKVKNLLKWGREKLPSINILVHMNPVSAETLAAVEGQNWKILSFDKLELEGKSRPVQLVPCKGDDLCAVCYTSGTTGKPKGAMIVHNGLYRAAKTGVDRATVVFGKSFNTDHVYLSYLPLAHIFEQILLVQMTMIGAKIGFSSGDITMLLDDIAYLGPTFFASVPRLLNKIHDMVLNDVNQSTVQRWLFNKGLDEKEKYYKRGIITKSTLWDKLVFKKIQNILGGRVRVILTGSAPIAPPVLRFLKLAFGAVIYEGYGQTESSAGISVTLAGEVNGGEVGPPLSCCMVKLADVPEMNYYAADNVGEICCQGVMVFRGYLHDEEKTKEAIDSEGWLHTGDIGMWTKRGTLKIVDRKKNIFKLSQGEYIAPEKIENVYTSCSLVAQCFVHGDSLQSALVAIVIPDPDTLPAFAKSKLGLNITDMAELCRNERIKAGVMKAMANSAKIFKLKGFEQVKDIYMTSETFTVENNLLTPTFKLKRVACITKYQGIVAQMYENLNQSNDTLRSSL